MAKRIINPEWAAVIREKIARGASIDETSEHSVLIQWLILTLSAKNIAFRLYNLGAGVKRITTVVEICPLCKKKLT